MSRLGKIDLNIPDGATVEINGQDVKIKGPLGNLEMSVRPEIEVFVNKEGKLQSRIKVDTKSSNAFWGMTGSLLSNMLEGVTKGYEKKLEIVGVGYRATQVSPTKISIAIGYSHPVEVEAPEGVTLKVEDNTKLTVTGIDKQLVGQVAANIRKIRKPEPYKGKGIRYSDEIVRRKAGKSGKTAAK